MCIRDRSHYPESEMAPFVNENRVNISESVYKLTDNTLVEKDVYKRQQECSADVEAS